MTIVTRRDTLLPDPEPRPVRATVISVDDHLVEPPGHVRGPSARPPTPTGRPGWSRTASGHQLWEFDGAALLAGRDERGGRAASRARHPRAHPVRGHAARLLGHRRPHRRHGPQRRVGLAQLPLPDHRVLGQRLLAGRRPRAGPGRDPGLERLAPRRVVAALPRPHHPVRDHLPGRSPHRAPPRSAATPSAGSARSPCPSGRSASACPRCSAGYWDPIVAACAGDRHRHLPPRGFSGMPDLPPDGPLVALGATLFGQMSLTACAEWLWSGLPVRYPDLRIAMSEGGIGWVAMLLDRLDNIVDRSGYGRGYDPTRAAPGRGAASATSGSAPSTTRPPSTPATGSASTTSWWRSTTPTATPPGPTPRT